MVLGRKGSPFSPEADLSGAKASGMSVPISRPSISIVAAGVNNFLDVKTDKH